MAVVPSPLPQEAAVLAPSSIAVGHLYFAGDNSVVVAQKKVQELAPGLAMLESVVVDRSHFAAMLTSVQRNLYLLFCSQVLSFVFEEAVELCADAEED